MTYVGLLGLELHGQPL